MDYDIGKIVQYHRKKAGLSQLELAEFAGVGKTVVFDVEKGKKSVRLNTLLNIFKVLNISFKFESPLMTEILEKINDKS